MANANGNFEFYLYSYTGALDVGPKSLGTPLFSGPITPFNGADCMHFTATLAVRYSKANYARFKWDNLWYYAYVTNQIANHKGSYTYELEIDPLTTLHRAGALNNQTFFAERYFYPISGSATDEVKWLTAAPGIDGYVDDIRPINNLKRVITHEQTGTSTWGEKFALITRSPSPATSSDGSMYNIYLIGSREYDAFIQNFSDLTEEYQKIYGDSIVKVYAFPTHLYNKILAGGVGVEVGEVNLGGIVNNSVFIPGTSVGVIGLSLTHANVEGSSGKCRQLGYGAVIVNEIMDVVKGGTSLFLSGNTRFNAYERETGVLTIHSSQLGSLQVPLKELVTGVVNAGNGTLNRVGLKHHIDLVSGQDKVELIYSHGESPFQMQVREDINAVFQFTTLQPLLSTAGMQSYFQTVLGGITNLANATKSGDVIGGVTSLTNTMIQNQFNAPTLGGPAGGSTELRGITSFVNFNSYEPFGSPNDDIAKEFGRPVYRILKPGVISFFELRYMKTRHFRINNNQGYPQPVIKACEDMLNTTGVYL